MVPDKIPKLGDEVGELQAVFIAHFTGDVGLYGALELVSRTANDEGLDPEFVKKVFVIGRAGSYPAKLEDAAGVKDGRICDGTQCGAFLGIIFAIGIDGLAGGGFEFFKIIGQFF